uniref:Phosphonoacetaldehyde hydrolase n=1 Tax=Plectus sambesii TaxID=2011161 RepID=A0A914X7M4_9BILA
MVWLNAIRMNVSPIEAIVKVDDTIDGIREGLAAGCWTVAVARTGNYTALEEQQLASGDEAEIDKRVAHAYSILVDSGAHYVIDSVADLMPVIDDIERRLRAGEKP